MTQNEYKTYLAAIEVGESAQSTIADQIGAIVISARTYRDSRLAEWNMAFPDWETYYQAGEDIFAMRGCYDRYIKGDGQLQIVYSKNYSDGETSYWYAYIPESLLYASYDERMDYFKTEFDKIMKTREEKITAARIKEDLAARAKFEELKARFGS